MVLFLPNVEKSKSSGFSDVSPVFSKKAFNSFLDLNRFPLGPIIKTSYLPAEAPLFRCETFLCQPWGNVSSSMSGVRLGSVGWRLRCVARGEDLGGVAVTKGVLGCCCCCCMTGSGIMLLDVVTTAGCVSGPGAVCRMYCPSGP